MELRASSNLCGSARQVGRTCSPVPLSLGQVAAARTLKLQDWTVTDECVGS